MQVNCSCDNGEILPLMDHIEGHGVSTLSPSVYSYIRGNSEFAPTKKATMPGFFPHHFRSAIFRKTGNEFFSKQSRCWACRFPRGDHQVDLGNALGAECERQFFELTSL